MELNQKQKSEIEVLEWFGLKGIDYSKANSTGDLLFGLQVNESMDGIDADLAYFDITSKGIKDIVVNDIGRLKFLIDSKKWVMRQCDMYEEDILNGIFPYIELLDNIPRSVAIYLSKKMFQGSDQKLIMSLYEELNS